jgi:hypothetical protein
MRKHHLFAAGCAAALTCMILPAEAQTRTRTQLVAQPEQKCLRALDGSCTNFAAAETARLRAIIIPTVLVSYYGTPAGTVGGYYIPFERLFRDNPLLFGLPTNVYTVGGVITRSK